MNVHGTKSEFYLRDPLTDQKIRCLFPDDMLEEIDRRWSTASNDQGFALGTKHAVRVEVEASHAFVPDVVRIENPGGVTPERLGLKLPEEVTTAWISLTICPADAEEAGRRASPPVQQLALMMRPAKAGHAYDRPDRIGSQ